MQTEDQITAEFERFDRSLTNHTPSPVTVHKIEEVRDFAKELGTVIISNCEPSRERSLALTHLEETTMWAVKSLVLYEQDPASDSSP